MQKHSKEFAEKSIRRLIYLHDMQSLRREHYEFYTPRELKDAARAYQEQKQRVVSLILK